MPHERLATDTDPTLELVPRNCALDDYTRRQIPRSIAVSGRIVAYSSPDSTFAVTRRLIRAAETSITVGTYDFNSSRIETELIGAAKRGVDVRVMLDVDSKPEGELVKRLRDGGVRVTEAPACGGTHPHFFPSCHEKITVIDRRWAMVQSGNYTDNSIPPNSNGAAAFDKFYPGNRDMGLAVESTELAAFFEKLVLDDIELATTAPGPEGAAELPEGLLLFEKAPSKVPTLFPARTYKVTALPLAPVISPENYVATAIAMLERANTSIVLEQQYIRPSQPQIRTLLDVIKQVRTTQPDVSIRIVLAPPFGSANPSKLRGELDLLAADYGLRIGHEIKLLNKDYFAHCHNKLVVVDSRWTLVGSQNWSDTAVSQNREASLALEHRAIARFFTKIFDFDWSTGLTVAPAAQPGPELASEAAPALIPVAAGDYAEV